MAQDGRGWVRVCRSGRGRAQQVESPQGRPVTWRAPGVPWTHAPTWPGPRVQGCGVSPAGSTVTPVSQEDGGLGFPAWFPRIIELDLTVGKEVDCCRLAHRPPAPAFAPMCLGGWEVTGRKPLHRVPGTWGVHRWRDVGTCPHLSCCGRGWYEAPRKEAERGSKGDGGRQNGGGSSPPRSTCSPLAPFLGLCQTLPE